MIKLNGEESKVSVSLASLPLFVATFTFESQAMLVKRCYLQMWSLIVHTSNNCDYVECDS